MPDRAQRVLIVDDERHIRDLLEIGLGDEGYEVRSAADGLAGLALAREWSPDVIVLDVMMPKLDGITALPLLRKITEAPILMLSAKGDVNDKVAGLAHGADDYLAKPFEMAELLARLGTALRRPRLAKPQTIHFADLEIDLETRAAKRGSKRIALTAREYDLLVMLLRNPNRVLSRDQLLDAVWGTERFVSAGTVETYISYVRAKVDQGFPTRLIHTHRGVGYSLREEHAS